MFKRILQTLEFQICKALDQIARDLIAFAERHESIRYEIEEIEWEPEGNNWYACEMKVGPVFCMQSEKHPDGEHHDYAVFVEVSFPPGQFNLCGTNSYDVHYGPDTYGNCREYLADIHPDRIEE